MTERSARRRRLLFVCLALSLAAAGAFAQMPTSGLHIKDDPPGYRARVETCLNELRAMGIPRTILDTIDRASIFTYIRMPVPGRVDEDGDANGFQPARDQASGRLVGSIIFWDPDLTGSYMDGTPRDPCSALLHELKHAADNAQGTLTGVKGGRNQRNAEVDAVQIQNWYLWTKGLKQRVFYGPTLLPNSVLWGQRPSVLDKPVTDVDSVTLTVVNQSPNHLLVVSHGREIQCGGTNPYFRGVSADRRCAMRVPVQMASNPFAVPIVTLTAYYPSGDPSFPRAGRVVWTDQDGKELECRNSFSENCAIEMGTRGGGFPPARGNPMSKTVRVKWATGGTSAIASAAMTPGVTPHGR
jgi:hypothetical protein